MRAPATGAGWRGVAAASAAALKCCGAPFLPAAWNVVNTAQVEALRTLLASSGWLERTRYFARALRGRSRTPNGLLIVGTPAFEPWHMAAHLEEESRYAGIPELAPTLIRWSPPHDAPPHLRVGIDRIERADRAETLLVVGHDAAPGALLERVADARKAGVAIFALDRGDNELDCLAHESLAVRPALDPVSFDGAQHLVSMAVGDQPGSRYATSSPLGNVRDRLARLLNAVSGQLDT
jgi:hypothetical protein